MKSFQIFSVLALIAIYSCSPLRKPIVVINESINDFKYIFVSPTSTKVSELGGVYGNEYGTYGATTSKSVNPKEIISGILTKNGFIMLPEIKPELESESLIAMYGESGTRPRAMGYTIEVTIQFISAKSNLVVCSCSAEGQGETEVDDIRQAINRCLAELLNQNAALKTNNSP